MDTFEKFMTGLLIIGFIAAGSAIYQERQNYKQDKRNERQWAQERASKKSNRLERLYRVQCASLDNIPYVAIESKESDRLEKMYRLELMQCSTSSI